MDTEVFCALRFQDLECLKNLLGGHAVFGITWVVHDVIADLEQSAWIITAADGLRNITDRVLHALDMGDIV